ncbi:MAG: PIN domain-containing protein [Reichenbachiella sp.]|uniref:PIN domain-containing protein n=1 Tax=Reichenbachiella sp. TaxID=2184521 RepID=UPI003263A4C3
MKYVFDTSPLADLFRHYYPSRFPTLWENFDVMIKAGEITSTREVLREIEDREDPLSEWAKSHEELFMMPNAQEAKFVSEIYRVAHFQQNIELQKIYKGGKNADPFVIARAGVLGITVVTNEKIKPNAAKIPNICQHFDIGCINLEKFMEGENWKF